MLPRSFALVVLAFLFAACAASTALAADDQPPPDALELIDRLERAVDDESSNWSKRWKAYKAAKEGIGALKGEEKEEAEAAYLAIRGKVAEALRRESLGVTGWAMGVLGALLLWGGLAFHIRIAMGATGKKHPEPLEGDESWPLRPEDES